MTKTPKSLSATQINALIYFVRVEAFEASRGLSGAPVGERVGAGCYVKTQTAVALVAAGLIRRNAWTSEACPSITGVGYLLTDAGRVLAATLSAARTASPGTPIYVQSKATKARLDADGTAKPLTELTVHVRQGDCIGPASTGLDGVQIRSTR